MHDNVILQEHIKHHPPDERGRADKYPKSFIPDRCTHTAEDKMVSVSSGDYIEAFSAAEKERTGPVSELMGKSAREVKDDFKNEF